MVPLAGDTLRGEVREVSALRNTLTCRFRPSASAAATDYTPAELRAYGLTGLARYEARPVPPADSTQGKAPHRLFVEVLVSGPAQLYACRDRPGHTRYLLAVGGPEARLRELAERRVKTFSNGFEAYETRALYRDTLAAALRACPAVQVQLPRLPLQQAALARVITSYNVCLGEPVAAQLIPAHRHGPVLSLVGGYQYGSLSLGSGSLAFSSSHTGPVGGLALGFALPHTRHTVSARLEALYSAEQYQQSQFNQNYLNLPLQLRYTLMRSLAFRPFAEAGIMYSHLLHAQNANPVQAGQFGFVAGVGASVPLVGPRRLGIMVRVTTTESITNPDALGSRNTCVSALLSFDLTE